MRLNSAVALSAFAAVSLVLLPACEEKKTATPAPAGTNAPTDEHKEATAGHGGPVIELGTATIGAFEVKATRDQGEIVAGKDAPIDVTVTPAPGSTAKATSVRFWVGTEDAQGSVKAKADIENPAEPNRWHTHAEIPNPIPEGSRLWVEIETEGGEKAVGSFDLKT